MEVWKDIPNYEGLYQVSNKGRVKSFIQHNPRILKATITKGYLCLRLCKNGIQKHFYIHRLVAMTFIENPKKLTIINHKDKNPLNNDVNNLEWCTQRYNMDYSNVLEKAHNSHKRKVNQYDLNGNYIETHASIVEVSKKYNINHVGISRCCRGLQNTAGGFIWRYKEVK